MTIVERNSPDGVTTTASDDNARESAAYCPHCAAPVGHGADRPWPPDPTLCPACERWIGRNRAIAEPAAAPATADDEDGRRSRRPSGPSRALAFLLGRQPESDGAPSAPPAAPDASERPDVEAERRTSTVEVAPEPPSEPEVEPEAPELGAEPEVDPEALELQAEDEAPHALDDAQEASPTLDEAPEASSAPAVAPDAPPKPEAPDAHERLAGLAAKAARVAEEAEREAEEAERDAEEANRRSQDANSHAEDANHEAEEANRRAEAADSQAEEASRRAEEAKRRAEGAQRRAEKAKARAEEAKRRAEEAGWQPADDVAEPEPEAVEDGDEEPERRRPLPAVAAAAAAMAASRRHVRSAMQGLRAGRARLPVKVAGITMLLVGVLLLGWGTITLVWKDPFTALQTARAQKRANVELDGMMRDFRQGAERQERKEIRRWMNRQAAQLNLKAPLGHALGKIDIPKIGVNFAIVQGTDDTTLQKGPGHYAETPMPGAHGKWTVGIAGHRTTYDAPFRRINELRPGNVVRIQMPYALFKYEVYRTRIVDAADESALAADGEITGRERYNQVALTACHPLFSAAQRIIVYAKLRKTKIAGRPH